jgi:hypothetical protein
MSLPFPANGNRGSAQITCALHIEASASRQRLSILHNDVAITLLRVYAIVLRFTFG